jgi:5'-nucleotidase
VLRRLIAVAALAAVTLVPACGSDDSAEPPATNPTTSSSRTSTSPAGARPLRVLVTNDDGVDAPGIDTLVEAVRKLPDTTVTVVAPAKNQSGTGGKTTAGTPPTVTDATTASGYPAKAVDGFPADTIVWAIDGHGVATRPDVVLSGVNAGQNLGIVIDLSGTVGAARAAAQRGIPALAVSAGLADNPAFAIGAREAVAWLTEHRAELRGAPATVTNINVPSCPNNEARPLVVVPVAGEDENPLAEVDCDAPAKSPATDVSGFLTGYIVQTDNVPLRPAA